MRLAVAIAILAVVVAAFLGARLVDHERCEDARKQIFSAALGSGEAPASALDRVRESCRGTTALVSAAGALHVQGRDAEAARLAREATEREPDNANAWRALAETSQAPAEARAAARRLTELDPKGPSLKRSAGRSTR